MRAGGGGWLRAEAFGAESRREGPGGEGSEGSEESESRPRGASSSSAASTTISQREQPTGRCENFARQLTFCFSRLVAEKRASGPGRAGDASTH